MFEELAGDGAGLKLVDASNAFNSVIRVAALWNARVLWPRASRFLFNTYQGYSHLVLEGCSESQQGGCDTGGSTINVVVCGCLSQVYGGSREVELLFADMGVSIKTGCRYLGGYVGDETGLKNFTNDKVKGWVSCVERVAEAAVHQPQALNAVLVKSIQAEWSLFQRDEKSNIHTFCCVG